MNTSRLHSRRWIWIVSVWFGLGLFDATQTIFTMHAEGMHHAWLNLFLTLLITWLPWALATPIIMHLGRKYPPIRLRPISNWMRHLAACLAIGMASAAWTSWLEIRLNPWANPNARDPFLLAWRYRFYNNVVQYVVLYASTLAIIYMLESKQRLAHQQTETARLNEQLSRAQLDAVRRQIEPHFLFNTLNAIAGLVREERNDAAVNMIVGLSDFLRRVVEDSNRQQVPLGEELEFTRKYLEIQKMRFAERLRLRVDVPAELFPAQVPSLILQPMVENAVKHGIAKRVQGGEIRIAASRSNGTLKLSVYNDGPSLPSGWETTASGIGISNVRSRLQGLYGNAFQFTLKNQDSGGVEASFSVPFVPAPPTPVPPCES
jgi:two-component system, LytTR family, sensor kinase